MSKNRDRNNDKDRSRKRIPHIKIHLRGLFTALRSRYCALHTRTHTHLHYEARNLTRYGRKGPDSHKDTSESVVYSSSKHQVCIVHTHTHMYLCLHTRTHTHMYIYIHPMKHEVLSLKAKRNPTHTGTHPGLELSCMLIDAL